MGGGGGGGDGGTDNDACPPCTCGRCDIVLLYKMIRGVSKSSYGLHVARLAGLDKECLRKAAAVAQHFRALAAPSVGSLPVTGGVEGADDVLGSGGSGEEGGGDFTKVYAAVGEFLAKRRRRCADAGREEVAGAKETAGEAEDLVALRAALAQ